MREHLDTQKLSKDIKLREEREQLKKLKDEMERDEKNKIRSAAALKNEFLFFNDQKLMDNALIKDHTMKQT